MVPCYEVIENEEISDVECLIAGFPAMGLIGGIASEQLINSLDMVQVASLTCDEFPPTSVIFEGVPRRPLRFFIHEDLMLVKSDMVIPNHLITKLAGEIIDWSIEKGVQEIITLDGIPQKEDTDEVKIWGALSSREHTEELEEMGIEMIERGAIAGISSSLLLEAVEHDIKALGLFAEGAHKIPDPRASAALLEVLAEYKSLDIDIQTLLDSADKLEKEFEDLVQQTEELKKDMDSKSAHPPLYG
ncbi:MAG: proteasome assembly chaperone family protein [Thermoplasmatota archaeon]